jgi:Fur family transcriptional regulator, ferric uptake regulator
VNSKIIQILEDHKIKPTPMRMLVLEQFMLQGRNLSLSDIENLLFPADRITIYRTLKTFSEHGLAHLIETANNGTIYALCSDECNSDSHADRHPHFICESCKKVSCTDDFAYHLEIKSNAPHYRIHKMEMTIKGLCPECAKD